MYSGRCSFPKLFLLKFSSLTHTFTGFEDYGAYWRYNYETIENDAQFKYTRDELMQDVRSIYKQVREISVHVSGFGSVICMFHASWSENERICLFDCMK